MTALVPLDGYAQTVTPVSLVLKDGLTLQDYQAVLDCLWRVHERVAWLIGDLLVQAERTFSEGDAWAQLLEPYAAKTLMNFRWVAAQIPVKHRREALSWSHHSEVAALEESFRNRWLDRAEKEGWTRQELRRQMRPTAQKPECECPTCGNVHSTKTPTE